MAEKNMVCIYTVIVTEPSDIESVLPRMNILALNV